MYQFKLEELNSIPIGDVLEYFEVEQMRNGYKCPNNHKKPTKISVYKADNICKCFNCDEIKGDPIAVAKFFHDGDFKAACEDLHQAFNIPFGDNTSFKPNRKRYVKPAAKAMEYISFDPKHKYLEIKFEDYIDKYSEMKEVQQFKMVATAIYQFSLNTKQWGKTSYFNNIGISMKKNPLLKEKIAMIDSKLGFLFKTDIPELLKYLANLFPLEDMVKFGILNNALDKTPYSFRQSVEEGLIVIPNFDMHTNMCTGIKYRKTKLKSWVDKNTKETVRDTNKEPEFSYKRIANPLPYYLTREALLNKFITFRFFEGQKDLHSMPLKDGVCDVAIPGVNGISEEMLGLFRGRLVELFYDQDKAGQDGAMKIKLLLEKAGAYVINHTWDINLGADINDVLQAGNISKI